MSKKLYKYIGPDILDIAFNREDYCALKCSFPKDYNDPYELFLTIDLNESPDVLAYYNETVSEISQLPTTCFSKSPVVIPMWAHYAHSSRGFIIEIDEENLIKHLDSPSLSDITYQDTAKPELKDTLEMAYRRMKPRDIMHLRNHVHHSAYFTKHSCWEYEQERRLVLSLDDVETINENMVLFVPDDCVTSIITGSHSHADYKEKGKELCNLLGANYYEMKIGKSSSSPFFLDENLNTYIFNEESIMPSDSSCNECNEPIDKEKGLCSWCSISDMDKENAASVNTLRMFSEAGILDKYVKDFNDIGK